MKYILFILLFTPAAQALELIIDRTNHIGLRMTDVIVKEPSRTVFNGKDLGEKLPPHIQKSLNELEIVPVLSTNKASCGAGQFTYLKKDKKTEIRRTGCTEGKNYGRMIGNLESLRKFAKGKQ